MKSDILQLQGIHLHHVLGLGATLSIKVVPHNYHTLLNCGRVLPTVSNS